MYYAYPLIKHNNQSDCWPTIRNIVLCIVILCNILKYTDHTFMQMSNQSIMWQQFKNNHADAAQELQSKSRKSVISETLIIAWMLMPDTLVWVFQKLLTTAGDYIKFDFCHSRTGVSGYHDNRVIKTGQLNIRGKKITFFYKCPILLSLMTDVISHDHD